MNEWCDIRRVPQLGVDLFSARFVRHAFAPHAHEGLAFGVIEDGVGVSRYQGALCYAPAGSVIVYGQGETHTGHGADERGWAYRIAYVPNSVVAEITPEAPRFVEMTLSDPLLAMAIRRVHEAESPLAVEGSLLAAISRLIEAHGAAPIPKLIQEPDVIRKARTCLLDRLAENLSLAELAETVGMSRFHLLRAFQAETGMPPHRYLVQARVERAKKLLAQGVRPAEAALEVGFADQSHLNRHFKRIVGTTPARYARAS